MGFFAPMDKEKDSSPSIGGSLISSQEKSPATPPSASVAAKEDIGSATPHKSSGLFEAKEEKPASVKNLFGSDVNETKGNISQLKFSFEHVFDSSFISNWYC